MVSREELHIRKLREASHRLKLALMKGVYKYGFSCFKEGNDYFIYHWYYIYYWNDYGFGDVERSRNYFAGSCGNGDCHVGVPRSRMDQATIENFSCAVHHGSDRFRSESTTHFLI